MPDCGFLSSIRPCCLFPGWFVGGMEKHPVCVLIIEDEALVALDLAEGLQTAGFVTLGPAGTVRDALALIEKGGFDVVLLNAKLADEWSSPVAEALAARNIPFAFLTGYRREDLPARFTAYPFINKPFSVTDVAAVLNRLVRERGRN